MALGATCTVKPTDKESSRVCFASKNDRAAKMLCNANYAKGDISDDCGSVIFFWLNYMVNHNSCKEILNPRIICMTILYVVTNNRQYSYQRNYKV